MKDKQHKSKHQRRLEKELWSVILVDQEACLEEARFVLCRILKDKIPEISRCICVFCLTIRELNKKTAFKP